MKELIGALAGGLAQIGSNEIIQDIGHFLFVGFFCSCVFILIICWALLMIQTTKFLFGI